MTGHAESRFDVPLVHVLAGVLVDPAGRVLLAERPAGKAFAGRWEFPGGKLEAGETPHAALVRELREELGIEVLEAEPLLGVVHRYPGAPVRVLIDSWRVLRWRGTPDSLDGQRLRWCAVIDLPAADILEADRPIVTALRLPALLVEGVDVPDVAIAMHSCALSFEPASGPRELAGCIISDAASARAAADRGADFLLVAAPLDAEALVVLAALGLPWYVEERIQLPSTARPTGRWRRSTST
jgi:mutator protein MutT